MEITEEVLTGLGFEDGRVKVLPDNTKFIVDVQQGFCVVHPGKFTNGEKAIYVRTLKEFFDIYTFHLWNSNCKKPFFKTWFS